LPKLSPWVEGSVSNSANYSEKRVKIINEGIPKTRVIQTIGTAAVEGKEGKKR